MVSSASPQGTPTRPHGLVPEPHGRATESMVLGMETHETRWREPGGSWARTCVSGTRTVGRGAGNRGIDARARARA